MNIGLAALYSIRLSEFDVGPCDWVICGWVEGRWVSELTVVVFGVHSALGSLGNLDEVGKMLSVGEVCVEVVLEVLEEVHMVLNEVVSSDSCEGEGVVVKLPGVDADSWVFTLGKESIIDDSGVLISSVIECSREEIEFDVQLFLRNIESWLAFFNKFKLNSCYLFW